MSKEEEIKNFIISLGVDDVGFADICEYNSPLSDDAATFLEGGRSIIVLASKVLSSCESSHWSVGVNGYQVLEEFLGAATYRTARFLETKYDARVAVLPHSFPFEMRIAKPAVAEFSQRHAAVAAGLGSLGRNNLVIHPKFGARVNFSSIITDLELQPSPKPQNDVCLHCGICVKNCPVHALDEEGRTDVRKCMSNCLPNGDVGSIRFWLEVLQSPPEKQKELLLSERYLRLRQARHLGNQYMCFNCIKSCPIGLKKRSGMPL